MLQLARERIVRNLHHIKIFNESELRHADLFMIYSIIHAYPLRESKAWKSENLISLDFGRTSFLWSDRHIWLFGFSFMPLLSGVGYIGFAFIFAPVGTLFDLPTRRLISFSNQLSSGQWLRTVSDPYIHIVCNSNTENISQVLITWVHLQCLGQGVDGAGGRWGRCCIQRFKCCHLPKHFMFGAQQNFLSLRGWIYCWM